MQREKVRFVSGGVECAAWFYPGSTRACVVMAGGFAVTKEPGTDLFAPRFQEAGFAVLAFDYRRIGESGGTPRYVLPIRDQLGDWQAALDFAATLPGVDPARIAAWGFSASGGHVFRVAARNPQLAAVVAQTPNAGGFAATRYAARHQKPSAMLRFTGRAIRDMARGVLGRAPLLVPLAGPPGTVAALTTPDAQDGNRALRGDRYPDWPQSVAARSALPLAFYRPGRFAARVRSPLLVLVCEQDQAASPAAAIAAARRAPNADLVSMPGGHYQPFLGGHEEAVAAEVAFLRRHLLAERGAGEAAQCAGR